MQAGEVEAAINAYCQALERDPDDGAAVRALSEDLERSGDRAAALGVLEDFLQRQRHDVETLICLTALQLRALNLGAAEDGYRRALDIDPGNDVAVAGLMIVRTLRGDVEGALVAARAAGLAERASPAAGSAYVFAMNYAPCATAADVRNAAEAIRSKLKFDAPRPSVHTHEGPRKIGIVSKKLGFHPVNFFTKPLIAAADPSALEFHLFAAGVSEDAASMDIKAHVKSWHDITVLTPEERVQYIRAQNLDVAISPSGHEEGDILDLFRPRLAPVQLAGFAAFCTTGVRTMDGYIADRFEVPPGAESGFTEDVIRLPDGCFCLTPEPMMPDLGEPPSGPPVFGCFNNLAKICNATLGLWARILAASKGAKLVVKTYALADPKCYEDFTQRALRAGIDPSALILEGPSPRTELLEGYRRIDVALDPLAYSGGMTSLEAMWMGVPVVTLPGETFARRHTFSHLMVAGLDEYVAQDGDDYVDIACRVAAQHRRDPTSRVKIRDAMRASPTNDAHAYAQGFTDALRAFMA